MYHFINNFKDASHKDFIVKKHKEWDTRLKYDSNIKWHQEQDISLQMTPMLKSMKNLVLRQKGGSMDTHFSFLRLIDT